jgi:hypothetical protein
MIDLILPFQIKENIVVDSNGDELLFFSRKKLFDTSVFSSDEFFDLSINISKYIDKMPELSQLSFYIKIDNFNTSKFNFFNNDSSDFLSLHQKDKLDFIKDNKEIKLFVGIRKKFYSTNIEFLFTELLLEQLSFLETKSFLFDHINPGKRNNDFSEVKHDLVDSLFFDEPRKFTINDSNLRLFNLTNLDSNLNINSIISDLSFIKSNIILTIDLLNYSSSSMSKLGTKITFGRGGLGSIYPFNKSVFEHSSELKEFAINNQSNLCQVSISICLFNSNYDELHSENLNFNNSPKIEFRENKFSQLDSYLALVPSSTYLNFSPKIILSSIHCSHLFLVSSFKQTISNSIFTNKNNITHFYDFFNKDKIVNSTLISAPTGRGKSVLLNYIFLQYIFSFGTDLRALIIDYGGSYENLINALNIDLDDSEKIAYQKINLKTEKYNIFDIEFNIKIEQSYDFDSYLSKKIGLIIDFFKVAIKDDFNEKEETLLSNGIEETYKEVFFGNLKKRDQKGIIIDRYNTDFNINDFFDSMPIISDLSSTIASSNKLRGLFDQDTVLSLNDKLSIFTVSQYGKMFSEKSNTLFSSKKLVVDFKDIISIDSSGYLASLFFLFFAQMKYSSFSDKKIKHLKKIFFIDEYPQIIKASSYVEPFVDKLLKTGRKENIDTFLIAQNIDTFKKDFFIQVGNIVMFQPGSNSEIINLQEKLNSTYDFVSYLNEIKTKKNVYSELFVLSNDGDNFKKTMLRLKLTPFEIKYLTI